MAQKYRAVSRQKGTGYFTR